MFSPVSMILFRGRRGGVHPVQISSGQILSIGKGEEGLGWVHPVQALSRQFQSRGERREGVW